MERKRGADGRDTAAPTTGTDGPGGQWWHDAELEEPAFGTPGAARARPGVPHPAKPEGVTKTGFDLRGWVFAPRFRETPGIFAYGRDEAELRLAATDARARRKPDATLVRRALLWLVIALAAFGWFVQAFVWVGTRDLLKPAWPVIAPFGWFFYAGFFGYLGRWHELVLPYLAPALERLDRRAEANGRPDNEQWQRAGVALAVGVVAWAMLQRPFVWLLLEIFPDSRHQLHELQSVIRVVYNGVFVAAVAYWGRWPAVLRPYIAAPRPIAKQVDDGEEQVNDDLWPELRDAGFSEAAERLDEEAALGRLSDVDYLRLRRVLEAGDGDRDYLADVAREVAERGAGACTHGSGARDVRPRRAVHDLLLGQVKVGRATDGERNTTPLRAVDFAVDPDVLGTSMVVVGPSGAGESEALLGSVIESLSLSALAGAAAVVVLDAKGGTFARPGAYDIEIVLGDPESPWGIDPYGAARGTEEAADRLVTAALGGDADDARLRDGARTALHHAISAHVAAYGHHPAIAALLDLLDGHPETIEALRTTLADQGREAEFERALRMLARADETSRLLVQRLSVLERPGIAALFDTGRERFAMRHIDRPVRVRVALNEALHPDAARIVGRLLVGQFVQAAAARDPRAAEQGVFACLVADNAGAYVDDYAAQGLAWTRGRNAGLLLAVRSMDDFAPRLRATVFGAVGGKAVLPGAGPRDAEAFAEHWGKTLVEERSVTRGAPEGGPVRRARFAVMGALFGEKAGGGSESVTVRSVERFRWSPSEIAGELSARHVLCSLTNREGERTGPVLVELDRRS
ncbi:hypothetical protein LO772_23695 [Yinghuangia sp. ASG 101]|uniref:hypothetical protein n=1 Tax=Yinghuangia sp. ASG 101 TaxID=2896848 RepID=UPI001E5CEC73|nr:hypothetical protein [Yinghuangia sp. ASG 101]UGQ09883.1 hypothetical protein LO772_23695 [Yinghuangia sp. ASG 101]